MHVAKFASCGGLRSDRVYTQGAQLCHSGKTQSCLWRRLSRAVLFVTCGNMKLETALCHQSVKAETTRS